MELVKTTNRRVGTIYGYGGVCNACGAAVEYKGQLTVIEIDISSEGRRVVPIDTLSCPHCGEQVITMMIWRSLEVSEELQKVRK